MNSIPTTTPARPPSSFVSNQIYSHQQKQISDRALPYSRPPPIQASTDVHPGRSRRGTGPLPHAEHRSADQDPLQGQPVHRRQPKGRHVSKREPHFSHPLQ